jgi:hypothetical protein
MNTRTLLRPLTVLLLAAALAAPAAAPGNTRPSSQLDETGRFIFYSVLEGLYEDGVSTEDAAQILLRKEKQTYFHFIYSCPICNPTIWALETYRARPQNFYGLKHEGGTFGAGLSAAQRRQLHSDDPDERLAVINELVRTWMERRMNNLQLSKRDREKLTDALEKKRQEGMEALERFRKQEHGAAFGVAQAAPAYAGLKECAICNAAVGKSMQFPAGRKEK